MREVCFSSEKRKNAAATEDALPTLLVGVVGLGYIVATPLSAHTHTHTALDGVSLPPFKIHPLFSYL